jgi:nitrogen regulatory protein PII 2
MKLILSVIRIAKMNETKKALSDAGLPSFTAMGVLGRGRGRGIGPNYEKVLQGTGADEMFKEFIPEPRLKSKRMITLIVPDDKKDIAVDTIIKVNRTNNSGDGRIFVIETIDAVRVRTGERGDLVLD